jgi:hypothetical protein
LLRRRSTHDAGGRADHAVRWCLDEYGLRRHSRTERRPLEQFRAEEQPVLLPAPATPYDIPLWSEPKVARDQLASVGKAMYSMPHAYVGHVVTARADTHLVRFDARGLLIKTHPRQAPGGQSIDASDYPVERSIYALRNVDALRQQATHAGAVIGQYAAALLDSPLPWTRMRRVYALLGLVRRYGAARVTDAWTVRSPPTCSTSTAFAACSNRAPSPRPPCRRRASSPALAISAPPPNTRCHSVSRRHPLKERTRNDDRQH